MGFKYNSEEHVFNIVNKNLRKKLLIPSKEEESIIINIIKHFWDIERSLKKVKIIEYNNVFKPVGTVTWYLFEREYNSVEEYIKTLKAIKNQYNRLLETGRKDGLHYITKQSVFDVFKNNFLNKDNLNDSFLDEMESVKNKYGVYFLYDKSKELIYVGKSKHIGERLLSSIVERNAHFYEYAFTNSMSDMTVYELYYISLLKPKLNEEGKHADNLTFKLECIRDLNVKPVFKEKISIK